MNSISFTNPVKAQIVKVDGTIIDVPVTFNGVTTEGKNELLNIMFDSGTQLTTWYLGLIDNAGFTALADADTMVSHTGWVELTDYTEGTRVLWDPTVTDNVANNAAVIEYNINATVAVKGVFIPSDSVKGATAGKLWSTASFASVLNLINGDILRLTYQITVN